MLILDIAQARAALSVQREAARLLSMLISGLDATPLPDGSIRLTFEGTFEIVDRLSVWSAAVEDFEDGADVEDDGTAEDDERDLPKVAPQDDLAERREQREIREVARELLSDLQAEAGPLPTLTPRAGPLETARAA